MHSSWPGQHAAEHDEVGTAAERFGQVAGRRAAAVGADQPAQAVGGIGALDDRRQLRVTDAGHLARGAHRARADADLDDIGAVENQLLGHLAGHHVAGHDGDLRVVLAQLLQEADERLGIAVGHIDANVLDQVAGKLLDAAELPVVRLGDAHRITSRTFRLLMPTLGAFLHNRQGLYVAGLPDRNDQAPFRLQLLDRSGGGMFGAAAVTMMPSKGAAGQP